MVVFVLMLRDWTLLCVWLVITNISSPAGSGRSCPTLDQGNMCRTWSISLILSLLENWINPSVSSVALVRSLIFNLMGNGLKLKLPLDKRPGGLEETTEVLSLLLLGLFSKL